MQAQLIHLLSNPVSTNTSCFTTTLNSHVCKLKTITSSPKKGIKSKTYSYHQHSTEHTSPTPAININFFKGNQSPNMLPALLTTSSLGFHITLDSTYSKLQTSCLCSSFPPPGFRLDVASSRKSSMIPWKHPKVMQLLLSRDYFVFVIAYLSVCLFHWTMDWHFFL